MLENGPAVPPVHTGGQPPTVEPRDSWITRWRAPLFATLVAIAVVFGVLDLGSVFFHPASQPRSIVIHAQIVNGATATPHSDLTLQPQVTRFTCHDSQRVVLSNPSSHARQWSLAQPDGGIQFAASTPRGGTLGPGSSVALLVTALGQPGTYAINVSDDQGGTVSGSVIVQCP